MGQPASQYFDPNIVLFRCIKIVRPSSHTDGRNSNVLGTACRLRKNSTDEGRERKPHCAPNVRIHKHPALTVSASSAHAYRNMLT